MDLGTICTIACEEAEETWEDWEVLGWEIRPASNMTDQKVVLTISIGAVE